jgi:hypothetical protein
MHIFTPVHNTYVNTFEYYLLFKQDICFLHLSGYNVKGFYQSPPLFFSIDN